MLFNLSLKNFRKSIRDYSIYFFTLILGVAVFYIFNAIETQSAMLEVSRTKENILQIMNSILEGVSLVISFILGYLIVYASSFMLKRRKKEFGIYLILGMKKRQVAGILWLETVFMGMISLAAGLIIGIGLSQFMSLLVSNLFEADVSAFRFVVSAKAVGKTILYFLVIYLVVMFLNTFAVSRARLVDFLLAKRKKEKNLLKHPNLSVHLVLMDIEEYKLLNGWNYTRKRGATRYDRVPLGVRKIVELDRPEDYMQFVPIDLEDEFIVKDFAKAAMVHEDTARLSLNILNYLGVVRRVGKKGNAYVYSC